MYVGMAGAVLTTAVLTNFIKISVQSWATFMSALLRAASAPFMHCLSYIGVLHLGWSTVICRLHAQVGRPRPDFLARCFPSGGPPAWDGGFPLCSPNAIKIDEGRKSFPSGTLPHTWLPALVWRLSRLCIVSRRKALANLSQHCVQKLSMSAAQVTHPGALQVWATCPFGWRASCKPSMGRAIHGGSSSACCP